MSIENIKRSLLEVAKTRLPTIEEKEFYPDPPVGQYTRPCAYLTFKDKKISKDSFFGMINYDYSFDFTIENKEAADAVTERVEDIESAFIPGELILYYHFDSNSLKTLRAGKIEVKSFRINEGAKNRMKNSIQAELVVTF